MARELRKIDIKEFASNVERMCDFFIDKYKDEVGRDGSDDLKVLEDLKDDAADIQTDNAHVVADTLSGFSKFMRGV